MVISPPPSSSSGCPSGLTSDPVGVRAKAPARVSRSPCGRHHREVALALDGEVERAAGLLQRPLQLLGVARPRLGHRHAAALDGQRLHLLGEDHALAAVAGGGEVRDVVRDRLELLGEARLARQGHVAGKVHAPLPRYSRHPRGRPRSAGTCAALVKNWSRRGRCSLDALPAGRNARDVRGLGDRRHAQPMHNPCTTRMPANRREGGADRPDPGSGLGRRLQDREEGRAEALGLLRAHALDALERRRGWRGAPRRSGRASCAVQSSGLPRPSAPRASATCAACSRSKSAAVRLAGEAAAGGVDRRRRARRSAPRGRSGRSARA